MVEIFFLSSFIMELTWDSHWSTIKNERLTWSQLSFVFSFHYINWSICKNFDHIKYFPSQGVGATNQWPWLWGCKELEDSKVHFWWVRWLLHGLWVWSANRYYFRGFFKYVDLLFFFFSFLFLGILLQFV